MIIAIDNGDGDGENDNDNGDGDEEYNEDEDDDDNDRFCNVDKSHVDFTEFDYNNWGIILRR